MAPVQSLEAWEYNPSDEDQRCEHKYSPSRPVSPHCLEELGVLSWKIDVADCSEANTALEEIKAERGYKFWETVTVAPGKLENYEAKLVQFFQEHLHPYDESRLILEGSGYWDIRTRVDGEWIRFRVEKGDMIVLPPGMYHRFTLDTHNYIKALLLYTETPSRIDVLRPDGDALQVRKDYIKNFLMKTLEVESSGPMPTLNFDDGFMKTKPSMSYEDDILLPNSTLSLPDEVSVPISTQG